MNRKNNLLDLANAAIDWGYSRVLASIEDGSMEDTAMLARKVEAAADAILGLAQSADAADSMRDEEL